MLWQYIVFISFATIWKEVFGEFWSLSSFLQKSKSIRYSGGRDVPVPPSFAMSLGGWWVHMRYLSLLRVVFSAGDQGNQWISFFLVIETQGFYWNGTVHWEHHNPFVLLTLFRDKPGFAGGTGRSEEQPGEARNLECQRLLHMLPGCWVCFWYGSSLWPQNVSMKLATSYPKMFSVFWIKDTSAICFLVVFFASFVGGTLWGRLSSKCRLGFNADVPRICHYWCTAEVPDMKWFSTRSFLPVWVYGSCRLRHWDTCLCAARRGRFLSGTSSLTRPSWSIPTGWQWNGVK